MTHPNREGTHDDQPIARIGPTSIGGYPEEQPAHAAEAEAPEVESLRLALADQQAKCNELAIVNDMLTRIIGLHSQVNEQATEILARTKGNVPEAVRSGLISSAITRLKDGLRVVADALSGVGAAMSGGGNVDAGRVHEPDGLPLVVFGQGDYRTFITLPSLHATTA